MLRTLAAVVCCMALLLAVNPARDAQAAPLLLVVDRYDDEPTAQACTASPNDCSLRGAVLAANANPGPDTITLPAGTYPLTQVGTGDAAGDLDLNGDLTINGDPANPTIIDGYATGENVLASNYGYAIALTDLTITGGQAYSGAGISNSADLTLTRVIVDGNDATGFGGGITTQLSSLTLVDSTVRNNTAALGGGGLVVYSGSVTISSSTLYENLASGSSLGGAIYQFGGAVEINNASTITINLAFDGGGIYVDGGTLSASDSAIDQNHALSSGGGIYINTPASVTLTNTSVSSNQSTASGSLGGGIRNYGSLVMHGGQLDSNTAGASGGGLWMYMSARSELYDASVTGNHTTEDPGKGGGISNDGGVLILDGVIVENNYVTGTDSSLSYGGGIYSTNPADVTLTGSQILNNAAIRLGGGVYFENGSLTVTDSLFRGNSVSSSSGGGGGLYNGYNGLVVVRRSELSGNDAAGSGGGIFTSGTLTLENVTLSGNSALSGAGLLTVFDEALPTTILNSTIYGNLVPSGTGSGGLEVLNYVTIKNSIIAGNDNGQCNITSGFSITSNGYNISSDASCGFGTAGDLPNTDPLLGPLTGGGGFSKTHALLPGSPALDAGTNSGCPVTDQRGVIRPIDGDRSGTATCDIGAYEAMIPLYLPLIMR